MIGSRAHRRAAVLLGAAILGVGVSPSHAFPTRTLLTALGVAGASFGYSVGTAGDVNGDGFSDILVGAPFLGAGQAFVFFGGPAADSTADLTLAGESEGDEFGRSVRTAGDVNGDGVADLIIGSPHNDAAGASSGRAYLYLGGAHLDAIPDLVFTGEASTDRFGLSVDAAGDVNGDGYDDVVAGAGEYGIGQTRPGRAYVFFGGPGADAIADRIYTGTAPDDHLGTAVAGAGDVNGDGFADVLAGAPFNDGGGAQSGRAYLYFGGPGADAIADLVFTGEAPGDQLGRSVAGGDVNGDGYADLFVGAPFNDAAGADAGRAYVYFGGPGADGVADLVVTGEAPGDEFARSARTAGDMDGDGFTDLVVGAWSHDAAGPQGGRAYAYLGGPGMDSTPDLVLTADASGDGYGFSAGTAGDFDGDGLADLVVGAPFNDAVETTGGHIYVLAKTVPTAVGPAGPVTFVLGAPRPQPAHLAVTLELTLEREAWAEITVHDPLGRAVAWPLAATLPSGRSTFVWRPTGIAAGFYWLRARVGAHEQTRPLVWLGHP